MTSENRPAVASPAIRGARRVSSGWAWRRTAVGMALGLSGNSTKVRQGTDAFAAYVTDSAVKNG